MKELNAASKGDNIYKEPDYGSMYEVLGLNETDDPSVSDINRAYRKKALKCHPDKGGDMLEVSAL
jgi:curved DNA-binding protein CbpA